VRFEPGEEAAALRAAVEGQLHTVTPAVVRAGWPGGDDAVVRDSWRKLAACGFAGALVTESSGGIGLDEEPAVRALEAVGRSGLPAPVVETVLVAAPLLELAGSPRLEDVLTGEALVAAAPFPSGDGLRPPSGQDLTLLPYGQVCDLALLRDGDTLTCYERGELDLEPLASVDGARRLARVTARRGGTVLTDDPALLDRVALRAALGTAALLNGLSRRMLEITVGYVKERRQFGVPIGSFQAIKHALASALLAVSFAEPPAYAASWELAHQADGAAVTVSLAKAMAAEAALRVARTAIQCHGAIAYTTEYDLQLFAKRAWALAPAWGDARWHRDRIAAHVGLSTVKER
jgi:alkylation response protein AidB-like acyl-CoA dehydrogenase